MPCRRGDSRRAPESFQVAKLGQALLDDGLFFVRVLEGVVVVAREDRGGLVGIRPGGRGDDRLALDVGRNRQAEQRAALALNVALTILLTDPWGASTTYGDLMTWYLMLVGSPIETAIGRDRPVLVNLVLVFVIVVMLGWPQLAFALLGGFLSRRYRVCITRR
jgi:hypothetical protein